MAVKRRRHERQEHGFTLIELLVTIIILSILVGIAVPSYLSFRGNANDKAAEAALRTIAPSIEDYYSENETYVGMTLAGLKASYDKALDVTNYSLPAGDLSSTGYCVESTSGGHTWRKNGPSAVLQNQACP